MGLAINLLWGGNLVAVKMGLAAVPPLWSAFFRFGLGAAVLFLWARLRGVRLALMPDEWPSLLTLCGLFFVQIVMMNYGTSFTAAGVATVVHSTNPLWVTLFSHFIVPGDRMTVRRTAGQLLALGGVAFILLHRPPAAEAPAPLLGGVLLLGSGATLAARLVISKGILQRIETTKVVFWQMALVLPAFALAASAVETLEPGRFAWKPLAAIAYQGIVIAGVGFMVSASLIRRYRPSVVTSFNFTAPLFGVLLSVILLGEELSGWLVAGMAAVAAGLVIVTTAK